MTPTTNTEDKTMTPKKASKLFGTPTEAIKQALRIETEAGLGTAFANWRCECGRHASVEHSVGGYCGAKEIILNLRRVNNELLLALQNLLRGIEDKESRPGVFEADIFGAKEAIARAEAR